MEDGKTKSLLRGRLDLAHSWILSVLLVLIGSSTLGGVVLPAFSPSPARAAFGFESLSSVFSATGGATGAMSAGSHPESFSTTLAFNVGGPPDELRPEGFVRNLRIELPVGLVATPALLPQCSRIAFLEDACSPSTAVGTIDFASPVPLETSTVFLLDALPGQTAELGFHASHIPIGIDISISSTPPYGSTASLTNISQEVELFSLTLRLEGSPNGNAFLTLPRSCADSLQTGFAAFSWDDPTAGVFATSPESQPLVDCGDLPYAPALQVAPTTSAAASPSGLVVRLDAPDPGLTSLTGRTAADTGSAILRLPPGLTINPPAAAGLTACTTAELAAEEPDSPPGQGCPRSSSLGTATVTTPLFSEPIDGTVYLGVPEGSASAISTSQSATRLALYLVLHDAERGILLSVPIQLDADPGTGRLSASLDQIPQLPLTHLELHFDSGTRAPLTTSATCGSEAIAYSLAPSSGNPPVEGADSFTTSGPDCNARFVPALSAGTTSNAAGHFAAFVFALSQGAAAPNPSAFSVTLPSGLSAAFGAVTPCPDGQAVSGACPAGSKLGYAQIALGSGPEPLWVPPGEEPDSAVYLAGPYKGAPYSLVIVVPGQAGPFDLGTVVLRAPIAIDPRTARASLSIDELPQILDGVPLHYRTIRVVLDRPGFIRNPTSCEPTAITGTARATDGSTAAISSRFQAADCAALGFRPKLSLQLSGAVRRNGHPGVRAVLRGDPDDAAVSSANITLPSRELLDLRHLRGLCPRDAGADRCPKSSRLGHLRLATSLLTDPLEGPVYLRVPRHRLPEVSAELRSGQLDFVVAGRTTDANGRFGIKLESIPDVPFTEAVLSLPGGRKGIVVNSRSLCGGIGVVAASLGAHNGRVRALRIRPNVRGC
jgi:hypothetical protein